MAGFGSFMEGLQGGISSMQDIRRKRQLDEIYDQEITLGREKVSGRDHSRARAGLPALKKFSSGDPFLFRLMEKLGRGTGTTESPTASALPTSGETDTPPISLSGDYGVEMPELDPTQFEAPEYEFADGTAGGFGDWLDDEKAGKPRRDRYNPDSREEIARRAESARAGRPAAGGTTSVEGDPSKYRPAKEGQVGNDMRRGAARAEAKAAAQSAIPETAPKGRIASGVAKVGRFARGAGAGALAGGAIGAALENSLDGDAKLAEYYRRINRPGGEKNAGPWEAAGVRTMGVLQDVGRTFLPQAVEDRLFPYLGESEQAPAEAPQKAPQEALPVSSGPTSRRYPGQGAARRVAPSAAGPAQAVPTAEANPLADFDISKVSAEQIPNFSNKDWESFRDENIQELVANGMSYAEAWDKVDQQTIATQRRGFLHFASQADALLAGGDKKGAAAAVRAAFQYMPSTTDLKVGEYNGHVVAFGVDEETGEQIGTPIVVTPELLQQVQMNFANPQVWAQYAQDRRKLDQADTELQQGSRRLDIMEEGLGIERENALTRRIDAIGGIPGQGGSSLKESDIATARRAIDDWAFGIGQSEDADPALGSALKALAEAEYKRRGGDLNTITLRLEEVLKASGEAAIIAAARRLASGQ